MKGIVLLQVEKTNINWDISTPNQRQVLSCAAPIQHGGKMASLEIWQKILSNIPYLIRLKVVSCMRAIVFLDMVVFNTINSSM